MTGKPSSSLLKPNIVLTGMPGAGKSTVGVILAKEFCLSFVDTDILIQTGEGKTLQEIIDSCGLDYFLAIEKRYVTGLEANGAVIAPGGSVVLSDSCMRALRERGIVIFLDAPLDLILSRINEYNRGIVKKPGFTLEDVWRERMPLYRSTADFTIACGRLNQTGIAARITLELRSNWST
jgi:shikimate kinase